MLASSMQIELFPFFFLPSSHGLSPTALHDFIHIHSLTRTHVHSHSSMNDNSQPGAPQLDKTWLDLEAGIDHIMNHLEEGLSYQRYMDLYTYAVSSGRAFDLTTELPKNYPPSI